MSTSSYVHVNDRNFLLMPKLKVAICSIEKCGTTLTHPLVTLMNADIFYQHHTTGQSWPGALGWNQSQLDAIFTDPEWRTIVVLRDPIERFVSTYNSKCNHSISVDKGGFRTCELLLSMPSANLSLNAVAQKLTTDTKSWKTATSNVHWRPQARFCGGLMSNRTGLQQYTTVITYDEHTLGIAMATAIAGRLPRNSRAKAAIGYLLGVQWSDNGSFEPYLDADGVPLAGREFNLHGIGNTLTAWAYKASWTGQRSEALIREQVGIPPLGWNLTRRSSQSKTTLVEARPSHRAHVFHSARQVCKLDRGSRLRLAAAYLDDYELMMAYAQVPTRLKMQREGGGCSD